MVLEDQYIDLTDQNNPIAAYRIDAEIVANKADILDDGIDIATLTLPDPCFVSVNGQIEEVIGGAYAFASTEAGTHYFELVGKYRSSRVEICVYEADLAVAKAETNDKITKKYEEVLYGGFDYNGYIFDSDQTSMNLISGAASEAARTPLPPGFAWKTQDNQLVPMDRAALEAMAAAMFGHINAIFTVKETKKTQLAGLSTLPEILSFDIESGWN